MNLDAPINSQCADSYADVGSAGDIFGFERACHINSGAAQTIDEQEQRFRQTDVITLLTLETLLPDCSLSVVSITIPVCGCGQGPFANSAVNCRAIA
jgi:hypothetical protein